MNEKNRQILALILVFVLTTAGTAVVLSFEPSESGDEKANEETLLKESSPPVASMYASNTEPEIGQEVIFNASSSYDLDGTIQYYVFNFGDHTEELNTTDPVALHIFEDVGDFQVSLVVIDDTNTMSTNEMSIIISVQPISEIDEIQPSTRSLDNEKEAEEFLKEDPLSEVPEIPINEQEMEKEEYNTEQMLEEIPKAESSEFRDILGREEKPVLETPEPELDLEVVETDLENLTKSNRGMDFAERNLGLEPKFINEVTKQEVTVDNFESASQQVKPLKEIKDNYGKFKGPTPSNLLKKHTNSKFLLAVDVNVFDNNSDGNNEFAKFNSVAYELKGSKKAPVYESFYFFHMVVHDNDSDGNPEFVKIDGFGYESYDRNLDGNVEFAYAHVVRIVMVDSDDNGEPNFVSFFEGEFMKVDANSNGNAELKKANFREMLILNNGTTQQPNFLRSNKWGFVAVDKNNDSNKEYALVYGERFVAWDNDTSNEQFDFVRYQFFFHIRIDKNDDSVPEIEKTGYEKWLFLNQDGDENPNLIAYDKIYISRNRKTALRFVHGEKVRVFDNDSNGNFDYASSEKFSYLFRDRDNDGNKEFEGLYYQSFRAWDNKTGENESDPTGDGEVDYVVANSITYTASDQNDDGKKESERVVLRFYLLDNDHSDGTSGEVYMEYDSASDGE